MKKLLTLLLASTMLLTFESCGQKHACGSKHQKKMRNQKVKRNTSFMTY